MELLHLMFSAVCGIIFLCFLLKILFPWIYYDLKYLAVMLPLGVTLKKAIKEKKLFITLFEEQVQNLPENHPFLMFENQTYTFKDANKKCNRVARVAQDLGWKCHDVVALMNYNDPSFVWTFMGLQKVGIRIACINTNLRSKSLLHSLQVLPNLKGIIVGKGEELHMAINEIYPDLVAAPQTNKPIICLQGPSDLFNQEFLMFDGLLNKASDEDLDTKLRAGVELDDPLCLVYTSGTTGLPKAAVVSNKKRLKASLLFSLLKAKPNDRIYTTMPLYHSAAIIGLVGTVHTGATMILKKKFSASHFWEDCRKYEVTIVQYIGEMCRYLLTQPKSEHDKLHKVRAAMGNGLRKDIFAEFQRRFRLKTIMEFYGATEGNVIYVNFFNIPGSVGRMSPLLSLLTNAYLVECDLETVEPKRDANGRCIIVKIGEPGLLIGKVKLLQEFEGYVGQKDLTEKKRIRNAFVQGDEYFNSGDILVQDKNGFVYFSDRIGDTFRWKAENVSTVEVGNTITDIDWIEDANVYGVEVPGYDGRCGMVSLTLPTTISAIERLSDDQLKQLYNHCEAKLPYYARPRFVRLEPEPIITGTFKQQKMDLKKQGFHPEKCSGALGLYFMDVSQKTYIPLSIDVYEKILSKDIRV